MLRKALLSVVISIVAVFALIGAMPLAGGASPSEDVGAVGPTGPNLPPTPNMGLQLPTPGFTSGTFWAQLLNGAFTVVDGHNHTPGYGVQVPSAGLNINADLDFQGNNGINFRTTRFVAQGSSIVSAPPDIDELYAVSAIGGDSLYFNDNSGAQVPIVVDGALAGLPGSISGLIDPAIASYSTTNGTFTWQQNTTSSGQAAPMDMGTILLRNTTGANNAAISITSPLGASGGYTLTLPTAVPGSTLPVSMGASGALSTGTITASQITNNTITRSQVIPLGSAVSGCSGNFQTTNYMTSTPVTNLCVGSSCPTPVTFTTTGGPVLVTLNSCNLGGPAIVAQNVSGTGPDGLLELSIDNITVAQWSLVWMKPMGTIYLTNNLSPGAHTIKMLALGQNRATVMVEYVNLSTRELL